MNQSHCDPNRPPMLYDTDPAPSKPLFQSPDGKMIDTIKLGKGWRKLRISNRKQRKLLEWLEEPWTICVFREGGIFQALVSGHNGDTERIRII